MEKKLTRKYLTKNAVVSGLELTQQLFPMGRGKMGGGGEGGKAGASGAKAIPSRRLFPRLASLKGRHCSQGENQNTQD